MSKTMTSRSIGTGNRRLTSADSTMRRQESARSRWHGTKTKVKAMGFFNHCLHGKSDQRDVLIEFMTRMKQQRKEDAEELNCALEEYRSNERPSNLYTGRPQSPSSGPVIVPFPELPTYTKYEVPAGCKCTICLSTFAVFHEHEAYPCRVCDRVFHLECLEACGDLTRTDKYNIDRAHSNIGWSCPYCANISLLLTTDEVKKMTDDFERIDFNHDAQISLAEFLRHSARQHSLTNRRGDLLPAEKARLTQELSLMDQDGDGKLDWWEFVNNETKFYLAQKDKSVLVAMLSKKELYAAKATFNLMDIDGDGRIKEYEVKAAYKSWFKQFEGARRRSVVGVEMESDSLEMHAQVFTKFIMDADTQRQGDIRWEDFIMDQALYILCSRPNSRIPSN